MPSGKEKLLKQRYASYYRANDVLWNNEIRANLFVSLSMVVLSAVLLLSYLLASLNVFEVPMTHMRMTIAINIPLLLAGIIVCYVYKGQKHWIKYMLCIICILVTGALCSILNIFVTLILAVPVVLSVRYYSVRLTRVIAGISVLDMILSQWVYSIIGMVDLNLVSVPAGSTLNVTEAGLRAAVVTNGYQQSVYGSALFRGSLMPRLLLFAIIALTCIELAKRAHESILEQAAISEKNAGIQTELDMAQKIQTSTLPKSFPTYPDRTEFDIYASMTPAKQVGGDFYDFYLIDDDHLGLVMADVSGKGIPAALFMMVSRTLLKSQALSGHTPAQIVTAVNEQLSTDNQADMFVTTWFGILQLSTGVLTCVDAGHENPFLRRADGCFEVLKDRKCFVMGGMDSTRYHETTLTLHKGDILFLYTDGIPEANNATQEQFGMKRTLAALNSAPDPSPDALLKHMHAQVNAFVKDAPQFDDMTMLALIYNGPDTNTANE